MRSNGRTTWVMRTLIAGLLVLGVAGFAEAFEYTVRPGDTLMSIAENQLGSAKRWREIAHFNHINDPSQLQVGVVLLLPDDGPAVEEPVRPETAVIPPSVGPAVARPAPTFTRTASAPQPTPAPSPTTSQSTTTATTASSAPAPAPTTGETSTAQSNTWALVQKVGGGIMQHGLIAIVMAAGCLGMMVAWLFSLVTPRNLLALGFAFLVITAALFFVTK